jgi:hypothetical protein
VLRGQKARLAVLVRHGREVPADDLELGVLPDKVDGHLEHPQVEVGDGAEGSTCDQHERRTAGIAEGPQPLGRELVTWRVVEPGRL